jgi:hypothetical protein
LVAAAHAAIFIAYQRPDWNTQWTDQNGYLMLGRILAQTGRYTRFANTPLYVPEAIRTPVYPAFVAVLDLVFGESHSSSRGSRRPCSRSSACSSTRSPDPSPANASR